MGNIESNYTPIELDASVPDAIQYYVRNRVEPYLRDVRLMLEAPPAPMLPALNMSIATVLCTVVGGVAPVFHNELPGDAASFKATAEHFPLKEEPQGAINVPSQFARELYKVFRNGLVHSLGLHMNRTNSSARWSIVDVHERYVIARQPVLPVSEEQLIEMEKCAGRPSFCRQYFASRRLSSENSTRCRCVVLGGSSCSANVSERPYAAKDCRTGPRPVVPGLEDAASRENGDSIKRSANDQNQLVRDGRHPGCNHQRDLILGADHQRRGTEVLASTRRQFKPVERVERLAGTRVGSPFRQRQSAMDGGCRSSYRDVLVRGAEMDLRREARPLPIATTYIEGI